MKKIFTLIATALMTMGASAEIVQVNINENGASTIPAGTVLSDNECFTATTTFDTSACGLKDDGVTPNGEYEYAHAGLTFPAWIDIRVNDEPSAENPNGTVNKTSVVIVAKKSATLSAYLRTGNNKEVKLFDQSTFEALPSTSAYTEDGTNNRWTWTWTIEAGKTYVLTEKGGTGRLSGFTYEITGGGETGGDVTGPGKAGIYRPLDLELLEVGDCSVAEACGVKVTPIRGTATTYRDEAGQDNADASDLYIGYSKENAPEDNKAASAVYAADEVIYPMVAEQSARQEEEYFGFTMEIPAGKAVNIDALDVYLLSGNAYQWQVEITDEAGNVVYKTQDKGIKINNYNKTAYTNGIHVTTTEVTEPTWTQALLASWNLETNYDVTETDVLPALTDLTGKYNVKVYYWGKWQKNLTYANVYVELSEGTTSGISSATTEAAVKDGAIYNIAGQRVSAPVKGQIYIQNGKKFIQK